ncbi:hypothetical protein ES703_121049 [subsurface metagenome]
MACLMIGCASLLFVADDHALSLHAHQNLVFGTFKIFHGDIILGFTGCDQSGLVDDIGQVGA